jgi:hypothetical protein
MYKCLQKSQSEALSLSLKKKMEVGDPSKSGWNRRDVVHRLCVEFQDQGLAFYKAWDKASILVDEAEAKLTRKSRRASTKLALKLATETGGIDNQDFMIRLCLT